MHLVSPGRVQRVDKTGQPVVFEGERGERLHINVLDHDLIRVQHMPDGALRLDRTWTVVGADGTTPLSGRLRDDLSPFPMPEYLLDEDADQLTIRTDRLGLRVHLNEFRIEWLDTSDRCFAADIPAPAYLYDRHSSRISHLMQRRVDEHYFGFGEVSGELDKANRRFEMRPADAAGYDAEHSDPLYKHWPFYITYVPEFQLAYGLFYDNFSHTFFDMGRAINALRGGFFRSYQAAGGDLDYYVVFGPTFEAVVERFTALTGRPALPPRWTLGYLGSTMSYTEAPDAQDQLRQFAALCQQHAIPCDMFHLSSGYTTNEAGERCVFTWNRSRVPDPKQMSADFHEAGIHVAANIKPYLLKSHKLYNDVAEAGGFVTQPDQVGTPHVDPFWSGGLFEVAPGSYVDFTNPAGFNWWKARVTDALLEYGIDAIWTANNEFEVRNDSAQCDGFGPAVDVGLVRPILTLLMARASHEAIYDYKPGERPFVLTRSGCPGIQRYAQTWSGDNATSWNTLRYNIPMGLGASLSGMPNIGHDVGGFMGPKPDAELFVRWVQNGIFHPRFTIHSWNSDGTVNEPWMYPDVLPIIRQAIAFRYQLIPYLYTLLFEAAHTGHPIIRPMVYQFPDDPRCRTESFDFMVGPNMLIASILEPGVDSRQVYVPGDQDWYDFHTCQRYPSGQTAEVAVSLDRIPVLVPSGGIIPLGKTMRYVGEQPDDVRRVRLFPHSIQGKGTFTLVEDDGISLDYRRGEVAQVTFEMDASADTITLRVAADQTAFPLPYTEIEVILPPDESRPLQIYAEGIRVKHSG